MKTTCRKVLLCGHRVPVLWSIFLPLLGVVTQFDYDFHNFSLGWNVATVVAMTLISWCCSVGYLAVILLVWREFRENVLARLAGVRVRDEREALIVGKAAKSSFLFMLAAFMVLGLFSSTAAYLDRQGDFAVQFVPLRSVADLGFTVSSNMHKTDRLRPLLPLRRGHIVLLLTLLQLGSYHIYARIYARRKYEELI